MTAHKPLPADLNPAIDQLRQVVEASADARIGEGEVHPDHAILELAAEIMDRKRIQDAAWAAFHPKPGYDIPERYAWRDASQKYAHLLRRLAKLQATTPAGLFAKAMACAASDTGASHLARSMAQDLLDNPVLRRSLWPANQLT